MDWRHTSANTAYGGGTLLAPTARRSARFSEGLQGESGTSRAAYRRHGGLSAALSTGRRRVHAGNASLLPGRSDGLREDGTGAGGSSRRRGIPGVDRLSEKSAVELEG